jgi:hypothetical protein
MTSPRTRFLFRLPFKSDWAFWLWVSISGLASLSTFASNLALGKLRVSGTTQIVSGILDAVITVFGNFLVWYLISLVWLLPRKFLSSKSSVGLDGVDTPTEDSNPQKVVESIWIGKEVKKYDFLFKSWRIGVGAVALLALFLVDQSARNYELNSLLTQIQASEFQMKNLNKEVEYWYNRYDEGSKSSESFYTTEQHIARIAREYAPRISACGSEIETVYVLPWHSSIMRAKRDYLNHANAWVSSLNAQTVLDKKMGDEQLSQQVNNTFEIVRVSLPKAVPIIDLMSLRERIVDITRE